YGKGSQAAMILDRHILEGSAGRYSLFDLIRELIRKHGTAFRRPELVSAVDSLAGGRSEEFLSGLLDRAGPLGADSLARTYTALRNMGRFGPASNTGAGRRGSRGGEFLTVPPATKF